MSQDTVSTTPGNTVTFTVAVPADVDLAALAPDAQVVVTGHEAIERSEPGGELLDTRGRLAAAIAGRLPPVTQETGIPVVNLAQPAAGQLAIPVVVDGDGTSGTPLALGGPGIHPVRLRLESAGQDIGDVLTFVQVDRPGDDPRPARRGRGRRHRRRCAPRRSAAGRPRRCHRGRADQAGRRARSVGDADHRPRRAGAARRAAGQPARARRPVRRGAQEGDGDVGTEPAAGRVGCRGRRPAPPCTPSGWPRARTCSAPPTCPAPRCAPRPL